MLHKPTNRRSFLRGLVAAPAVIAVERLMPVRSIIQDLCIIDFDAHSIAFVEKGPRVLMGYRQGEYGIWIRGDLIVTGSITVNKMNVGTLEAPFV
jgi:hypothetical protein